jgi:hypothetical protein
MHRFSRIFIIYWPGKTEIGDNIDNTEYIQTIQNKIENTHYCFHLDNFQNGKVFMAVKKTIMDDVRVNRRFFIQ